MTLPHLPHRQPSYITSRGAAYCGDSMELLRGLEDSSIHLVITSPPFALQRQKEYGNKDEDHYVDWLVGFARLIKDKLTHDGSLVLDLGGAYRKGTPTRSLYNFRVLLELVDTLGFHLAEEFYWYNPSKLPSPIEWVNRRKIRAKDAVNTVWWLSKTEWPKADIRKVLVEYSPRMKKLLQDPAAYYSPTKRPSGHDIGTGFAKDNGGAIPSNLLQIPNTEASSWYLSACRMVGAKGHPARFPAKLPEFFIRFLSQPGDLVLDIFAGSNTTGKVAEQEDRTWLSFEVDLQYVAESAFRFLPKDTPPQTIQFIYKQLLSGKQVKLFADQPELLSLA